MNKRLRGLALTLAALTGLVAPSPLTLRLAATADAAPSYRVLPEERARRARPAPRRRAEPPARRSQPSVRPAVRPAATTTAAAPAPPALLPAAVPVRPARPGARLGPGVLPPQAELEAFVDGLVRDAMATEHVAGVAVSVVGGGQVLLNKGYGFAEYQPRARAVDPNRTLFRLGSVSKTFTWITVMQQVEAGRMRLNAPVNGYLPPAAQVPDRRRMPPIQMRDLLTHTPGFEDRALGHLFERDPLAVRSMTDYLAEERPGRVRAPGVLPTYSNYGAVLAGAAAAGAAGLPFPDLVERRITGPLGMARTSFREPHPARDGLPGPLPAGLAADLSKGFRWTGTGFEPRPIEFIAQVAPAGGASSTSGDMARYMLAVLNDGTTPGGGRIYGPGTARAFRTVLQRSAPGVNGWAHGWMQYSLPGGFVGFGHGGATLSFYTSLVTVPELGLGVFVTTNTDTGRPLVERLPASVVARFYAPPPGPPLPGSPALEQNAGRYAGTYLTTRRAYGGLEGFAGRLIGAGTVQVTEDGRLLTPGGDGVRAWTADGPDGARTGRFRSDDGAERLVFELEDGRAVRWYAPWGGAAYERRSWLQGLGLLAGVSGLALIAGLLAIGGAVLRLRGRPRSSATQGRSAAVEVAAAVLWTLSAVAFAVWAASAGDAAAVLYGWPGPWLLLGSSAALGAALLSIVMLALLLPAWRADIRHGWSLGRRIRHTVTTVLFVSAAALLASWGALQPWAA